jgi:hypothetical protein
MKKLWVSCLMSICFGMTEAYSSAVPNKQLIFTLPANNLLKAKFSQHRYLKDIPKPIISKGDLILWNGKGLIWQTTKPFPGTLLITKKGIYQVEGNLKKPLIQNQVMAQQAALFDMLSKILNGSFAEVQGFKSEPLPSTTHGEWGFKLTPPEVIQQVISSIVIQGTKHISRITIHRPNGDKDDITIDQHTLYDTQSIDQAISGQLKALFND